MLQETVVPFLQDLPDFGRQYYQQDAAPVHTARIVKAYLGETFGGRLFARQMDLLPYVGYDFPPRSPDLTVMDFYLFGKMKNAITEDPMPTTLAQLRAKITLVYDSITPEEIRAAFNNIEVCNTHNTEGLILDPPEHVKLENIKGHGNN
jgi:hypothetical protein